MTEKTGLTAHPITEVDVPIVWSEKEKKRMQAITNDILANHLAEAYWERYKDDLIAEVDKKKLIDTVVTAMRERLEELVKRVVQDSIERVSWDLEERW